MRHDLFFEAMARGFVKATLTVASLAAVWQHVSAVEEQRAMSEAELAEVRKGEEEEHQAKMQLDMDMEQQETAKGRRCVRWGSASCTRWGPYHHCQVYGQRRCMRWGMWLQLDEDEEAVRDEEALEEKMKQQEAAKGRKCVSWGPLQCVSAGPDHTCNVYAERRCLRWSSWLQMESSEDAAMQDSGPAGASPSCRSVGQVSHAATP